MAAINAVHWPFASDRRLLCHNHSTPTKTASHAPAWNTPSAIRLAVKLTSGREDNRWCQRSSWCRTIPSTNAPRPTPRSSPGPRTLGPTDAFTPSGIPVSRTPTKPEARLRRLLRSEEHTSELQSLAYLVCRLLLEKKKNK